MVTLVDIANGALSLLGKRALVTSLDTNVDRSAEAKQCAVHIYRARDEILALHAWDFATTRATLDTPDDEHESDGAQWPFAFALPDDFNRALSVLPPGASADYVVRGRKITLPYHIEKNADGDRRLYTMLDQVVLRYCTTVDDPADWPSSWALTAWENRLAARIAGPMIGGGEGQKVRDACMAQVAIAIAQATAIDTSQRDVDTATKAPWETVRGSTQFEDPRRRPF